LQEVANDGTFYFVNTEIVNEGTVVDVTANINGSSQPLVLPPAEALMSVILLDGIQGKYVWAPYTSDTAVGGTVVWDLSQPKAAPLQIPGFEVQAVRPDGQLAVGATLPSGKTVYCNLKGQTSAFTLASGFDGFAPSCMNMNGQVAGIGFSASLPASVVRGKNVPLRTPSPRLQGNPGYSFCYSCDGRGGGTLLLGTAVQGGSPFFVSSINSRGACVGGDNSPSNANAIYWNPSGQATVLQGTLPGIVPTAMFIADNNQIFGEDTQSFPTSTPAILWASPKRPPVPIAPLITGLQGQSITEVDAVSSNGQNLIVENNGGFSVLANAQ
jgi:hypothetical protein